MYHPQRLRYLEKYSLLLLLCFFNSMLSAAECFSPLPGLEQGEAYVPQPIIASRLSNSEYNSLRELFGSLEGNWQGEAEEVLCLGDRESARMNIKKYDLQAEVDVNSSGELKIRANLESIENRTRREESYRLFLKSDRLTVSASENKGEVELVELYSDSVTFAQSQILRSLIPQEVLTKISHSGREFRIVRYFYNHGYLSSISRWALRN